MIIYAYTNCNIQQVYLIFSRIIFIFLQPTSCACGSGLETGIALYQKIVTGCVPPFISIKKFFTKFHSVSL